MSDEELCECKTIDARQIVDGDCLICGKPSRHFAVSMTSGEVLYDGPSLGEFKGLERHPAETVGVTLTPAQLVSEAVLEAAFHHRGQVDKAGRAYILHCLRVMLAVAALPPASDNVTIEQEMAAAVLHDTVEDTELTLVDIRAVFGPCVSGLVDGLTKQKHESYNQFLARITRADPAVRKIKLADIRDNLGRLEQLNHPVTKEMLRVKYLNALHRLGAE